MTPASKAPAVTGEWECTECGYLEAGVESKRPAQCPECGAPADALEFYVDEEEVEEDDWDELEDDEELDEIYDEDYDEDMDDDDGEDEEF